jgi:hypothetical protein
MKIWSPKEVHRVYTWMALYLRFSVHYQEERDEKNIHIGRCPLKFNEHAVGQLSTDDDKGCIHNPALSLTWHFLGIQIVLNSIYPL